jgi:glycosyltransferase involved in cell wall biosynthesis
MRILTFTTLFPNALEPQHGIFVKTRLQHFLKRHDAEVRVIAPVPYSPPAGPAHWRRYREVPAAERIDDIEVEHPRFLATPGIGDGFRAKIMAASLKRTLARSVRTFRPDILDVHYGYPEGVAAWHLRPAFERALGRRLPMTLTCRGTDLNLWPTIKGAGAEIRKMLKGVDRVIAVSEALRQKALELGCPEERAITLRNGVDSELFSPGDKAEARKKLGLPAKARIALMVGNLVELKGQHLLIDALPRLCREQPEADWHLLLVGKGENREKIEAQAAALGLAAQVIMPGGQPAKTLPDWYRAADVMVLASSREGWPNVVLEAFASGLPVIGTPVGGVPEIFADCPAARLAERSVDALTAALLDSRRLETSAARPHAVKHGWEATVDGMAALFRTLVDDAARIPMPAPTIQSNKTMEATP